MSVLVDDDSTSFNNTPRLIGVEIEGAPCKASVRNAWLKKRS
jgi:hypothetical protein